MEWICPLRWCTRASNLKTSLAENSVGVDMKAMLCFLKKKFNFVLQDGKWYLQMAVGVGCAIKFADVQHVMDSLPIVLAAGGSLAFALKGMDMMQDIVTTLNDGRKTMEQTSFHMKRSLDGCFSKLNHLERRMMELVQPGDETARLLRSMIDSYKLGGGECRWLLGLSRHQQQSKP